jgi:hypothetical protein
MQKTVIRHTSRRTFDGRHTSKPVMDDGLFPRSAHREVNMAAFVVAVDARCPLCGALVLSVGRGGRVSAEDLHPVPLHRRGGAVEGYMVCDQCAVLAQLPADLTLN